MRDHFVFFVLKKILELSLSLLILVTLTFLFLRYLPGGPFDQEIVPHPLVREYLEKSWHRNEGVLDQYITYIGGVLHGDLGISLSQPSRSVLQVIENGLNQTLLLNFFALVVIYVCAFLFTYAWASTSRIFIKTAIEQIFLVFISLPSLFLAPLLIYIFGFYLNLLPVAFLETPKHFILPILALSLRPMAYLGRLLLRSIAEQVDADYARTAKAKGLKANKIFFRHILRNSLVPVLSYSGALIVSLLSGSFLVEMLFAVPGLGSEFISSLAERDYTVICGLTLFYGFLLVFIHLLLDVVMKIVDPRLREPA